jgi:hypothetical protein
MALLLAMFQKMRLIREKNQLVLKQTKVSSKKSRVTKQIERTQKRYTSLFAQLDSQAKTLQNNGKLYFQNMFGFGQNSFNPYNYSGLNQNAYQNIYNAIAQGGYTLRVKDGDTPPQGFVQCDNDPNPQEGYTLYQLEGDEALASKLLSLYQANGNIPPYYPTQGSAQGTIEATGELAYGDGTIGKGQYEAFNVALTNARSLQNQQQLTCSNLSQNYDNNVSIWLEAQKAQLEAEQDEALEPLSYEDTMLELEKEQIDARLTQINNEIDSYTQLASQEAKQSAPTFGLA